MIAALPLAVTVLDPDRDLPVQAELVERTDGSVGLRQLSDQPVSGDLFVSPGWVDLHTHVYDGMTEISVRPDRVGLAQGVHLVADAGSAGQATVRGLVDYVLPDNDTAVRIWLNIGSHGLVHLHEVADPEFMDVDATLRVISEINSGPGGAGLVCGIKVRSSGLIVRSMGLQPLQLARLAAREAGLPLMVHVGEAPPAIDDILELLDAGDVVTHCFHGKTGKPWTADGRPSPALQRALDRGVLLDVGHGAASFSFSVARAAIAAGYLPNSISTDLHVRNIAGPVLNLASVMTKLLHCGMPLAQVVSAVTQAPRKVLRDDDPWLTDGGEIGHATVFRLSQQPPDERPYRDATGVQIHPDRHLIPVATVSKGRLRSCHS